MKSLSLPYHHQYNGYTCGPASLQMVLEYNGIKMTQHELASLLDTNSTVGTYHDALIEVLRQQGLYCYVKNNASITMLYHFLSYELPIIVHFIEPSSNEDHYAVVKEIRKIPFGKEKVVMNDPWNGENFSLSTSTFTKRWHDEKYHHKSWMLVVSREDFDIGKQYRPISES